MSTNVTKNMEIKLKEWIQVAKDLCSKCDSKQKEIGEKEKAIYCIGNKTICYKILKIEARILEFDFVLEFISVLEYEHIYN